MKLRPTAHLLPALLLCGMAGIAAPASGAEPGDVEVTVTTPATQPASVTVKQTSILTDDVRAAIAAGLVLIVGTAVASILALIKAGTARLEAKLANVKSEEHEKRMDRQGRTLDEVQRAMPGNGSPPVV